jgi:hypothetical protein
MHRVASERDYHGYTRCIGCIYGTHILCIYTCFMQGQLGLKARRPGVGVDKIDPDLPRAVTGLHGP